MKSTKGLVRTEVTKENEHEAPTVKTIVRKSKMFTVIQNIDSIAKELQEGYFCDKEMLTLMINRMLAFLNEVIKPAPEKKNSEAAEAAQKEAEKDVH